jgi:uncharacterized protein (DUF58 family)
MPSPVRELHYRIASPAAGLFPGHHRSRSGVTGFEFRSHAALQDAPESRRLDIFASLRDPFGRWMVRLMSQRLSIPVMVVADLSASMAFAGPPSKMQVLADFTESLAWSAWRTGDSFGFVGCDDEIRRDWLLQPTRQRGAGLALAQRLRDHVPQGRSAAALALAQRRLPQRRSLVFLVSDFHLPLADVSAVLASLAQHEVVPVVVWAAAEFALSPAHGLAQVRDPESGPARWLWWRPRLAGRWRAAHAARREALLATFRARRIEPLFIEGAFDADAVTRHFLA